MAEKRREAEAAIDLMGVQFERVRNEEEKRKGLIIVKAIYGKHDNDQGGFIINYAIFYKI